MRNLITPDPTFTMPTPTGITGLDFGVPSRITARIRTGAARVSLTTGVHIGEERGEATGAGGNRYPTRATDLAREPKSKQAQRGCDFRHFLKGADAKLRSSGDHLSCVRANLKFHASRDDALANFVRSRGNVRRGSASRQSWKVEIPVRPLSVLGNQGATAKCLCI